MSAVLQSIGLAFSPLRDADDAACLMEAAARVPEQTPHRTRRIIAYMAEKLKSITATPFQVAQFFSRMTERPEQGERFEAVVSSLPPGDDQFIVTHRTCCVVCSASLEEATNTHGKAHGSRPQLFSQDGPLSSCSMLWLRCTKCKAHHYYSYAVGGDLLPDGIVQVYPDWLNARYTHITEHIVFETKVLLRYRQQCLHSHTSFLAFSKEYSALAGDRPLQSPLHWSKRLAHVWRAFELVTWLQESPEHKEAPVLLPLSDASRLDEYLLAHTPGMLHQFIQKWGLGHKAVCRQPARCSCYILDGHMKCVRSVCANKHARLVDMGRLGQAALGCTHTPVKGSIFCRGCLDACAVKGAAGTSTAHGLDVAVETQPDPAPEAEPETAAEEAARHRDVFLVEDVLEAELQTVLRGGEAHRACARAKKLRLKVSWVGYPPEDNSWVCECNAGKAVVKLWKDKKAALAAEKREARQASIFKGKVAAENAKSQTGDFDQSAEELAEIQSKTDCKCLKELHGSGRAATAGILALVASCGLILAASEIYGAESLTQVHLFLFQVFFQHQLPPPEVLAYDDACHLSMFLINRLGRFGRSILAVYLLVVHKVKIVVDRFHWKNHTGAFCKRNNNPYKCEQADKNKTEKCEETFQWLARSKHLYRKMNEARFMFIMLRMMHHRNVFLCSVPAAGSQEQCQEISDDDAV